LSSLLQAPFLFTFFYEDLSLQSDSYMVLLKLYCLHRYYNIYIFLIKFKFISFNFPLFIFLLSFYWPILTLYFVWYFYFCTIFILLDYFISFILYTLCLLSPSSLYFTFNRCSCLQLRNFSTTDVVIQFMLLQFVHSQSRSSQRGPPQGDRITSVLHCSHWLDLSPIPRPSFFISLIFLSCLAYSSTIKIRGSRLIRNVDIYIYQNTRRQISEHGNIHNDHPGNLICYRICNRQVHAYKMEVLISTAYLRQSGVLNEDLNIWFFGVTLEDRISITSYSFCWISPCKSLDFFDFHIPGIGE
jgi:hypothetical protein